MSNWFWAGVIFGVVGRVLYRWHQAKVSEAWDGGMKFGRGASRLSPEQITEILRSCRKEQA